MVNTTQTKQTSRWRRSLSRILSAVFVCFSILCSSCINNHCNEQMYTPLSINLYSEIDTAKEVVPILMAWQGVGADSVITLPRSSVFLPLNSSSSSARFAVAIFHTACEAEVLVHHDSTSEYRTLDGQRTYTLTSKINNYYSFDDGLEVRMYLGFEDSIHVFYKPVVDTLKIDYENHTEFVSAECGCMNTFELKSVRFEHGKIGSTVINIPTVNNLTDAKHVKIYLENY